VGITAFSAAVATKTRWITICFLHSLSPASPAHFLYLASCPQLIHKLSTAYTQGVNCAVRVLSVKRDGVLL
jgi:hypothetical protein